MTWQSGDTWIVVTAIAVALSCAVPGALLVLRRMSMMGDAISHTVLPGIAVAFLVTHSRDPGAMFLGAAAAGLLTALLVQTLREAGRVEPGAAIGVVFTTLFAVGIILIRRSVDLDHVDLDPDCVLYGSIETSAQDLVSLGGLGVELPRAALINFGMFAINAVIVLALFKEFRASSFDPEFATSQGISSRAMHYLLMAMTAASAVTAFESVGSILVVAMIVVPAATAVLLTHRFAMVFVLSAIAGVIAAVAGHVAAIVVPGWFGFGETVTAGGIASVSGLLFAVVWMLAPGDGLLAQHRRRFLLGVRITAEDVLGLLYRVEESPSSVPAGVPANDLLGVSRLRLAMAQRSLRRRGLVAAEADAPRGLRLTPMGRSAASRLVRQHRLWETYLHNRANIAPDHVHGTAMRLEHVTTPEMLERLDEVTGRPGVDPHGHPLPSSTDH